MPLQRKKKKKTFSAKHIVTGLIIFLMVSSILGLISHRDGETSRLEYNGYDITAINNKWTVKVEGNRFEFDYHPIDLENINISPSALAKVVSSRVVYFTFDPGWKDPSYLDLVRLQFDTEIYQKYGVQFVSAITSNKTVKDFRGNIISYSLPIITCADSDGVVPIIYVKEAQTTTMYLQNGCVIMDVTDGLDLFKMRDRILYTLLGIMI